MALRTFIAVGIAQSVRLRALELVRRLRVAEADVKWVEAENLHLTLKFLGEVTDSDIPAVCRVVAEVAAQHGPIEAECRGAGAFPNLHRPRTIWLGVDKGSEALEGLQRSIEDALRPLGFRAEHRRYHPHLTLGRVRRGGGSGVPKLTELLKKYADFAAGATQVDEVRAYASFLDKSGPTYEVLGRGRMQSP